MDRPDSDAKAREERNNAAGDGDEWERRALPIIRISVDYRPDVPSVGAEVGLRDEDFYCTVYAGNSLD